MSRTKIDNDVIALQGRGLVLLSAGPRSHGVTIDQTYQSPSISGSSTRENKRLLSEKMLLKHLFRYGEMKRHGRLGITRSFCDLLVWGERKASSRSSSGKFSHRVRPETNYWHPCQCFKTRKKAQPHTHSSRLFRPSASRACILHVR